MEELLTAGLKQGFGYALFVPLLFYVLKTSGDREKKYQDIIDELTKKFNIIEDVQEDVKEIKAKMD